MNKQQSETGHAAEPDHLAWESCPPGTLSGAIGSIRAQRRAAMVGRIAASSAVVLFVVVGATILSGRFSAPQEFDFGGVRCREVRQVADDYLSGELNEDDPQLAQRVAVHVDECPLCGKLIDRMRQEIGTTVAFSDSRHGGTECSDPNCRHHHSHDPNPLLFFAQVGDAHWASR